jgi:hypothetical protein
VTAKDSTSAVKSVWMAATRSLTGPGLECTLEGDLHLYGFLGLGAGDVRPGGAGIGPA